MSRQRAQGTRLESAFVSMLRAVGTPARRLAEGGTADEGDVEGWLPDGTRIVYECKSVERLPRAPHLLLADARRKAKGTAAVVWKRSSRKSGNSKRSGDGTVVIVDAATWLSVVGVVDCGARLDGEAGRAPQGGDAA